MTIQEIRFSWQPLPECEGVANQAFRDWNASCALYVSLLDSPQDNICTQSIPLKNKGETQREYLSTIYQKHCLVMNLQEGFHLKRAILACYSGVIFDGVGWAIPLVSNYEILKDYWGICIGDTVYRLADLAHHLDWEKPRPMRWSA